MKRKNLIASLLLAAVILTGISGLTSCNKDTKDEKEDTTDVTGVWKAERFETGAGVQIPMKIDLTSAEKTKKTVDEYMNNPLLKGILIGFGQDPAALSQRIEGHLQALRGTEFHLKADNTLTIKGMSDVESDPTGTWKKEDRKVSITMNEIKFKPIPEGTEPKMKARIMHARELLQKLYGKEIVLMVEEGKLTQEIPVGDIAKKAVEKLKKAPSNETAEQKAAREARIKGYEGMARAFGAQPAKMTFKK